MAEFESHRTIHYRLDEGIVQGPMKFTDVVKLMNHRVDELLVSNNQKAREIE